jgi:hypothetical protein
VSCAQVGSAASDVRLGSARHSKAIIGGGRSGRSPRDTPHVVGHCRPQIYVLVTFLRWFNCSFHSMVLDVCEERVRHPNM